ncbi:tyrosine recombinase XerD [Andreesenia angusta]|uniref:Tyrosine recombinase XerD n=1 Tax=Andreesenia angusta TaxID=39480 RepID=A0A1S1VAF6_9FIRM|nr:tyrosine-type recombinase/integrase [Andreesenia angusta]OHW63572.1 tyrosine recombinase XerD [Andreesenia angusta]
MENLRAYREELLCRELSESTIREYLKDAQDFLEFADGDEVSMELLIQYKRELLDSFKLSTVNNKITIVNNYLKFCGLNLKLKQEKQQRKTSLDNVITEREFQRLIRAAENLKKTRLKYIMLTLYYTGMRVSELKFLTVETFKNGYMEVKSKGKHRDIPLSENLVEELGYYVNSECIESGTIFRTSNGHPLDRSNIFRQLKEIAKFAGVSECKVYPHSFRHLFAKQWLRHNNQNVLELANILGHSSLETTRIYTTLSIEEQRETIRF